MKKIIIIAILFLSCFNLYSQSQQDTILIRKKLGTLYQLNGKNLTPKQLLAITQTNQQALEEMKIAKSNYDVGSVFSFVGGFLIGWPIGTAIGGGDANWVLAGIGAGVVLIAIPFSTAYTKHATNAVRIYNKSLQYSSRDRLNLKFGATQNGIGLRITF